MSFYSFWVFFCNYIGQLLWQQPNNNEKISIEFTLFLESVYVWVKFTSLFEFVHSKPNVVFEWKYYYFWRAAPRGLLMSKWEIKPKSKCISVSEMGQKDIKKNVFFPPHSKAAIFCERNWHGYVPFKRCTIYLPLGAEVLVGRNQILKERISRWGGGWGRGFAINVTECHSRARTLLTIKSPDYDSCDFGLRKYWQKIGFPAPPS